MAGINITPLLSLLFPGIGAVVLLLIIAFKRSYLLSAMVTALTLIIAFIMSVVGPGQMVWENVLITIDGYSLFFRVMIYLAGLAVLMISYRYFKFIDEVREEFFILLLLAVLGANVLTVSIHFISFILGLEILTVSLYVMIGYYPAFRLRIEAGVKYLILAAVTSAFLLFGMALIYSASGTMSIVQLSRIYEIDYSRDIWLLSGLGLLMVGLGFKMALVPFHMWTPDIYQGAPLPVTTFVSTISKGAIVAFLVRLFTLVSPTYPRGVFLLISFLSILSMLVGNLLALKQTRIKRLLAYSSIAHLGYVMLPLAGFDSQGKTASVYYLAAYFITILGAFSVVTLLTEYLPGVEEDHPIEAYRGLAFRHPWLTASFSLFLFSLAGLPFTFGFMAKFYLFTVGLEARLWLLLAILIIASSIGIYYYLRIIFILYSRSEPGAEDALIERKSQPHLWPYTSVILFLTLLILVWGIYPDPLLEIISYIVSALK